jgi:hypothetical protein
MRRPRKARSDDAICVAGFVLPSVFAEVLGEIVETARAAK